MKSFPEGKDLKFDFGTARNELRENIVSKWIRLNGQFNSNHALNLPEATQFIKKGAERTVMDKQKIESIVKDGNIDDSKLIYQWNSGLKSDSDFEYKTKSPLLERNIQGSSNKLAKRPIPLHIASHYFKLSEEIGRYFHDQFKRESKNPKERMNQIGSNDEKKDCHSSNTTSLYSEINGPNASIAGYGVGLQTAPSNYQSQPANTVEKIPEMQKDSSSSPYDAVNVKPSSEVEPQYAPLAAVEKEEQEKNGLPVPGRCPPLNPLLHSLPHNDTDKSCGQTLEGSANDPDCVCVYLLAERNEEGCASKFYTLCYRYMNQSVDHETGKESFSPQVAETSNGQNIEIYSSGQEKQVNNYNQQSVNDYKLKLRRQSGKIELPAEIDKKANRTVLLDRESESKKDEVQSTTTLSETSNMHES
ncbi:hypothetical protein LOAG_06556 [Loa loa]|uniref:Uncharacterized protein n=1 Tax=Loa loa TaxID=7209 RepID=A0A1S0TXV0_LOALO|nr:hypothetical protein LOAG_06556 [Loa loa]EFO21928.1 hypothetical protein LOAG_06556 [Loa loa]